MNAIQNTFVVINTVAQLFLIMLIGYFFASFIGTNSIKNNFHK